MEVDISDIHIEPLRPEHVRRGFCCKVEKIQNYCRNNVLKQHNLYQIRAYVACRNGSPDILGFYYLCLTSLAVGKLDDAADEKFGRVQAVPAVYLGMIAVHSDYENNGIGKKLMIHAMNVTARIGALAGTYALTLDALDEGLVTYYKKFNFLPFKQGETGLEMFLPLKTILEAHESA